MIDVFLSNQPCSRIVVVVVVDMDVDVVVDVGVDVAVAVAVTVTVAVAVAVTVVARQMAGGARHGATAPHGPCPVCKGQMRRDNKCVSLRLGIHVWSPRSVAGKGSVERRFMVEGTTQKIDFFSLLSYLIRNPPYKIANVTLISKM